MIITIVSSCTSSSVLVLNCTSFFYRYYSKSLLFRNKLLFSSKNNYTNYQLHGENAVRTLRATPP